MYRAVDSTHDKTHNVHKSKYELEYKGLESSIWHVVGINAVTWRK